MSRSEVRELKRESSTYGDWFRTVYLIAVVAAFALAALRTMEDLNRGDWVWFPWHGIVTISWIAAFVLLLRLGYLSDPSLFVTAMFRRRRCPACAYDLSGMPEDDDHITICPECAAAWKLDTPPLMARPRSLKDAFESRRRES